MNEDLIARLRRRATFEEQFGEALQLTYGLLIEAADALEAASKRQAGMDEFVDEYHALLGEDSYAGTRKDWIWRAQKAENELADLRATLNLPNPLDLCSCGHRREGHHIWGKCHAVGCRCTRFIHNGEGP